MATFKRTPKPHSREEDYRDFHQRDIGDGWPYADEEVVTKNNEMYGIGNDEEDKSSVEIAADPAIESDGGPSVFAETTHQAIDDDGLEERISEKLFNLERWDENQITVTVHDGIATLDGQVETEEERRLINQIALDTNGIKKTVNQLILIGVDSHIPNDSE